MCISPPRAILILTAALCLGPLLSAPATGQLAPPRTGASGGPAPQYVHEVWTVEDGLPVNSINDLIQTRDGYLWLATFDGLVRFDGVRFTVFNTGNATGLPSNRIIDLHEATDGSLWMRTEQNHLVRLMEGVFTRYSSENGLLGNQVHTLFEDPEGTLWIGANRGVSRYRDGLLSPFAEGLTDGTSRALYRDRTGALWAGTHGQGLKRFKDGVLSTFTTAEGLPSNNVGLIYEDRQGTLWLGLDEGISRFRDGTLTGLSVDGTPWKRYTAYFFEDADGMLWIGTGQGIYHYREGRLFETEYERATESLLGSGAIQLGRDGHIWMANPSRLYQGHHKVFETEDVIRAYLHDREGSIWIATASDGLHRLKSAFFTVYSEPEGLPHKNVYPIYEDRAGALWFGTFGGGLGRLQDGVFTSYTTRDGLPSNLVRSLYEDEEGVLWVGTWDGGVCRFEDGTCRGLGPEIGPGRSTVASIYGDRGGNLWLGTSAGLYRYRRGTWMRYTPHDSLAFDAVRLIFEARDGTLWMGTNGAGLIYYRGGRFHSFTTAQGLANNLIRSIYQDADGVLWIGTEDQGLCRIELQGGTDIHQARITTYRRRDGLFDEVIHQILEDDFGRLWMSTNRGIFWVSRAELNAFAEGQVAQVRSTSYTERDGMRNREANGGMQPAGIKARDGRLWFPTQDGAVVVDPSNIQRNAVPPPVVVEQLISGERVFSVHGRSIRLAPGEREFQIEYTALSFLAPENVRFRYRLEGFNGNWVEAGARRIAYFTNVPPGRYTFRVVASNNDGVWNEEGATLTLTVAPYFYETPWFYVLWGLALVVLAWVGYHGRVRRLKVREQELEKLVVARTAEVEQQKMQLEAQNATSQLHERQLEAQNAQLETQARKLLELDEMKSRFFANISHEFRTPLTLTIGPLEDLCEGRPSPLGPDAREQVELALRNARRLLRLINQLLDLSKIESGQMKLHLRRTDVAALLRDVASAFSPLAERKRITYRVDVPPSLLSEFDPERLEQVFTNLLSNAFKFTPEGGTVQLSLRHEAAAADGSGEHVRVTVRDSGPGMASEKLPHIFERFYQAHETGMHPHPGTGIGLSLAKEFVELHGGSIEVESAPGFGSTFTVRLPHARVSAPEEANPEDEPGRPGPSVDGEAVPAPEAPAMQALPPPHTPALLSADQTTVLLVEDNADVRAYMRSRLAQRYRVVEATNGTEGLELARRLVPDLVISDVMMPETDGYAFCRALKQDPELDFIPVILLTARASIESRLQGLEGGADDYLTKPFDARELVARVENLITSRQRLRARLSRQALLHASPVEVLSSDAAFLDRVRQVIEAHLDDSDFSVEALASELGHSRGHLHRRLQQLARQSPTELVRRIRLERAAQLLKGKAGTVSEIAYGVGFKSVSHFCRSFREQYGISPAAYMADADRSRDDAAEARGGSRSRKVTEPGRERA